MKAPGQRSVPASAPEAVPSGRLLVLGCRVIAPQEHRNFSPAESQAQDRVAGAGRCDKRGGCTSVRLDAQEMLSRSSCWELVGLARWDAVGFSYRERRKLQQIRLRVQSAPSWPTCTFGDG